MLLNEGRVDAMRFTNSFPLCLWFGLLGVSCPRPMSAQGRVTPPEKPIWAKNAIALDLSCGGRRSVIHAPDHLTSVWTLCQEVDGDSVASGLEVVTANGYRHELPLRAGANELLWAPNSKSFFVNGGESGYAGFFIDVYQLMDSGRVVMRAVTNAAQKDMVSSFPPCKAWNRGEVECARVSRDPEYNMSGLGWSASSSSVYVFAEVPCSSSYGGIMCQVHGYELSVPDGRILRRLSAQETKKEWGALAAWKISVPEPPEYGPAHATW